MAPFRTLRTTLLAGSAALAVALAAAPASSAPAPADVDRQLVDVIQELDRIVEGFNVAQGRLQSTTANLQAVSAQLSPLEAAADQAQERVASIAAGAYRSGGIASMTALLTADSPGTLLDQLTVLGHLRAERSRDVSTLVTARNRHRTEQRILAALVERERTEAADLASRRATIEARIAQLRELEDRVARARPGPRRGDHDEPSDPYVPVITADAGGAAVRFAHAQIGKPYRYGAEGPETFDCSGLTMMAWRRGGVSLPHSAAQQKRATSAISRGQLRAGDLVFYFGDVHHVALYAGNGRVIDAPRTGRRVSMRGLEFAPIVGYGRPG